MEISNQLINGQAKITNNLAQKLSMMLSTSIDLWQNLQDTFDNQSPKKALIATT